MFFPFKSKTMKLHTTLHADVVKHPFFFLFIIFCSVCWRLFLSVKEDTCFAVYKYQFVFVDRFNISIYQRPEGPLVIDGFKREAKNKKVLCVWREGELYDTTEAYQINIEWRMLALWLSQCALAHYLAAVLYSFSTFLLFFCFIFFIFYLTYFHPLSRKSLNNVFSMSSSLSPIKINVPFLICSSLLSGFYLCASSLSFAASVILYHEISSIKWLLIYSTKMFSLRFENNINKHASFSRRQQPQTLLSKSQEAVEVHCLVFVKEIYITVPLHASFRISSDDGKWQTWWLGLGGCLEIRLFAISCRCCGWMNCYNVKS